MNVTVSLDYQTYKRKPKKSDISKLSVRTAASPCSINMEDLAYKVGQEGHTFCPAVFKVGERKADHFAEMQIFALDFDSGISFEEIENRAIRYRLPIAFAYHTFSSVVNCPKFRIIFINDVPVDNRYAAEIMIKMLMRIFKEADGNCKDVSRMFFGGKGLIGPVKQDFINIVSLTESFQRYLFETQENNYIREIGKFAKENCIGCVNNCLQIFCVHKIGSFEDFSAIDPYIYGSDTVFSSTFDCYRIIWDNYQTYARKKIQIENKQLRIDLKTIGEKCQLYSDFINTPHIHHKERFLLLTNLLHISGGVKRFKSLIEKKGYDKNEWRFYAKYIKDRGYKPQSCEGNCPYADQCNHAVNMVNTVKQKDQIEKTGVEIQYHKVDEVYNFIESCLRDALESTVQGVYLIPAQTAAGKTEAYCNLISEERERRFLVAVPTNRLKQEVGDRLRKRGVDVAITLSLDEMDIEEGLKSRIQFYYQIGLGEKVIRLLRDYVKENKDTDRVEIMNTVRQCRRYLELNDMIAKGLVLVTTHARLLTMPPDLVSQYTVIIDEDILSTIFKNIRTVSMQSVQNVYDSIKCPEVLKERLGQILKARNGEYERFYKTLFLQNLSEQELDELEVYDNINEISIASTFKKEEECIHYFVPQTVKEGKYIILSATCNRELYQSYFVGRFIKEYPYFRAKYQGRLRQFTAYSMSRQCMQDHREKLGIFLKKLQSTYKMITF